MSLIRIYIFTSLFAILTAFSQPNMQPKIVTDKFFKDYDKLKIITPAFKKKKGYTNYEELISFLDDYKKKYYKYLFC